MLRTSLASRLGMGRAVGKLRYDFGKEALTALLDIPAGGPFQSRQPFCIAIIQIIFVSDAEPADFTWLIEHLKVKFAASHGLEIADHVSHGFEVWRTEVILWPGGWVPCSN
jgi:hypothetical protein